MSITAAYLSQLALHISDLPPPPNGRTGFPWTEGSRMRPAAHQHYPRITIVTPSFQQGHFLEETIRSVLLQAYPNLEYFVIDGGSTDSTRSVLERYSPYLAGWCSEADRGQTHAINKGFAQSTGDIMGYLNSDDLLLPNALFHVARAFSDPNVQFVTGFRKVIDENSRIVENFIRDPAARRYLRHYCPIAQETTFWRRSAWLDLGELDENFRFAMDYEYWLHALDKGYEFHTIPHYLGAFRDYTANKTRSQRSIYFQETNTLYSRYRMGSDQSQVIATLGARWQARIAFYKSIQRQRWTNSLRLVMAMRRLMEHAVLCDLVISTWKFREGYRRSRRNGQTIQLALQAGFHQWQDYRRSLQKNIEALRAIKSSRDIALIPTFSADLPAKFCRANQIVLGEGWHSLEREETVNYRWSSGVSTFAILYGDGLPHTLRLQISIPMPYSQSYLELQTSGGEVISRHPASEASFVWQVALPQSRAEIKWYTLRWYGKHLEADISDKRKRAFQVSELSWETSAALAQNAQGLLTQRILNLLRKPPLTQIPALGHLLLLRKRLGLSSDIMTAHTHLWQTLFHANTTAMNAARVLHADIPARDSSAPLRCVIDCSTHYMNNNGDKAMLTMLIRRIRARYPNAVISIITNDPDGIKAVDPEAEPIVIGNRAVWAFQESWLSDLTPEQQRGVLAIYHELRRASPRRFWGIARSVNKQSGRGGAFWQWRIHGADAVFLMGGGYFTDAFAGHAVSLLTTLEEATAVGKPAFIVGCGFEPSSSPLLDAVARMVLPRVSLIGCREALTSPTVLERCGVTSDRCAVTGDDAVELAYEARSDDIGHHIGINIRHHSYNAVEAPSLEALRHALHETAQRHHAALVSLPISNYQPSDGEATRLLLRGYANVIDHADQLTTPQKLFTAVQTCRIVITGSYHAAVFALSMGIPAVCLYASSHYRHKMIGLLDLFGGEELAAAYAIPLDAPDLSQQVRRAAAQAWDAAPDLRGVLLEAARRQIEMNRILYDRIFDCVAVSRGQHSNPGNSASRLISRDEANELLAAYVDFARAAGR